MPLRQLVLYPIQYSCPDSPDSRYFGYLVVRPDKQVEGRIIKPDFDGSTTFFTLLEAGERFDRKSKRLLELDLQNISSKL